MPASVPFTTASLLSHEATDRRLWERFPTGHECFCRPLTLAQEMSLWPARIDDLSADGARMTTRRFEPNTLVVVEVNDLPEGTLTLLGRIVWVKGREDKLWNVGVKWTRRLTAQEVAPFADQPKPAATPGGGKDMSLKYLTTAQLAALVWE